MASTAGNASEYSLEHTPTWALATVCFIIVSVSIILERSFNILSNWLKRHKKTPLFDAVDKLKSGLSFFSQLITLSLVTELMLLGFMSLLLAVTQDYISKICIPAEVADTMLPCRKEAISTTGALEVYEHFGNSEDMMSMMNHSIYGHVWTQDRRLAAADGDDDVAVFNSTDPCSANGKVSLVTHKGAIQLRIFIFVLAVMQIVYSVLTMALGRAKMKRWKVWEEETQTIEYQAANDPNRFRFARQTTFGRRHTTSCTETSAQLWIKCFFRQFYNPVAKVDYLTLRHGFISAHFSRQYNSFNFQKYIQRSLDEDFKVVVSISPLMWFIVVIFLLLDVHGWNIYLWISYVPLLLVLVLGTKLEVIVAKMALQIQNHNAVIIGSPLVEPSDEFFWFSRPKFVLNLLHVTLFVNAFELAFFIWVTIQFGLDSCHHEHKIIIVTRVVLAVTVQVLCSYLTLPLYALVTQMGSQFRGKEVLNEHITKIMEQWLLEVREKRKKQGTLNWQSHQESTSAATEWSFRYITRDSFPQARHTFSTSDTGEIVEEEVDVGKEKEVGESSGTKPGYYQLPIRRS